MRSKLILGAALAGLIAAPALAQTATAPPAAPPAPATGTAADTSAAALAVGLPVKDNTGAVVGEITQLKPEAGGKQTATIKMGAETFAVDTASLAVASDGATINASQAELKTMIKASKPHK
jgi:hypothetical protein